MRNLTAPVFQRYHIETHLCETQHDGESQLALKLRHCHPMYTRSISMPATGEVSGGALGAYPPTLDHVQCFALILFKLHEIW